MKRKRVAPWGCRVMRRLRIAHRPLVYQSEGGICLTALSAGMVTWLFGVMLHRFAGMEPWVDAIRMGSFAAFGAVIGASIGVHLHHRMVRRSHQLPPWSEFLRQVEEASQHKKS